MRNSLKAHWLGKYLPRTCPLPTYRRHALSERTLSSTAHEDIAGIARRFKSFGGSESVYLDQFGDSARITIRNEGKRNAFSGKMMSQLYESVLTLRDGPNLGSVNTLFLTGADGYFCSGADLDFMKAISPHEAKQMSILMQETLRMLHSLPVISVAVIDGGAVGGGTELALSCDFRVMDENALFQMIHTRIGLVPGWGGASRLTKLLGRQTALKILCSGRRFYGNECLELGIADKLARDEENPWQAARIFVNDNFGDIRHPQAVRSCKSVISYCDNVQDIFQSMEYENHVFCQAWKRKKFGKDDDPAS